MTSLSFNRNRIVYVILIFTIIGLGLISRKYSYLFSQFLNTYLGDALWAVMIYLGMAIVFKRVSYYKIAIYGLLFCYGIEISQLYHDQYIDSVRSTSLGGLILGFGFLWTDIIAYTIGVFTALVIEIFTFKNLNKFT